MARNVIVGEIEPSGEGRWDGFVWIDTANQQVKVNTDGQWVSVLDVSGPDGISGVVAIANHKLTFQNGLCVKVE